MSAHHHSPTIPLSLGLTAVLLGTAGYTAHSTLSQSAASTQPAAHTATSQPLDLTVTASEFKLSSSPLVVPAGRPVRLTFVDKGVAIHNWTVKDLVTRDARVVSAPHDLASGFAAEMHTAIAHGTPFVAANPGERAVITFTPTKAGTYKTLCTIPGHAQMGMVGTLVVTGKGVTAPASTTMASAADAGSVRVARLPNPQVAPRSAAAAPPSSTSSWRPRRSRHTSTTASATRSGPSTAPSLAP